jgi:hypothetical protein
MYLVKMKIRRGRVIFIFAIALAVGAAVLLWQNGQPRREALQEVFKLADNLANNHGAELLDTILIPVAIQSRTPSEQEQFLAKTLADEISPAGVAALKRHAEFGPLKSIFPNEAPVWCSQAGVNAEDCVAFKMERAGIQAEIVLVHEGKNYRVVRCKDVKQMAGVNSI